MTKKLMMFAVAGLLTPLASYEGTADAEIKSATFSEVIPAPTTRRAPISNGRLRRTNEFQPGNEMATLAFFDDGINGLYFVMGGELNGERVNRRVQGIMVPFKLQQRPDGAVEAVSDLTKAKVITNNNGNEYRQFNHPKAYAINNGKTIVIEYNYQPNNSNDTRRYAMAFNRNGDVVMPQTQIFAKNNDDAAMSEDDRSTSLVSSELGKNVLAAWRGANGNGRDDGWLQKFNIDCDAEEATQCRFRAGFDVSLCPREERSHGSVSIHPSGKFAVATWTEGNTQPQRDGTWIGAVRLDTNASGANQQQTILWKKQVEGRKDIGGIRTYSMRAMHDQVMAPGPDGSLQRTDMVIWRSGDLRGNNNTNGKGGTYYRSQMAVMKFTEAGMSYVTPLTDVAPMLLGLDGTHLGMKFGLFGTTDNLVPGVTFLMGSHTGGGTAAQVRAVTWDQEQSKFSDAGMYNIGPYDRHLYPNYLGNNPGNQGRNYANGHFVKNPFVGQNGNDDAHLMVFATTGKKLENMSDAAILLSGFISVLPVSQTAKAAPAEEDPTVPPPTGGEEPLPEDPEDPIGSGESLGGCSTSSTTGGLASLLLIGLAAFIRRRR
jgi:MYXO-CTERM domain-containing protein